MQIEAKLLERGLVLPEAPKVPPGITISFAWTRRHGNRVYVSGHAAQNPDGSPAGPFGKVPTEVSLEAAQQAARGTALAILGSLKREVGEHARTAAGLAALPLNNAVVIAAEVEVAE